MHIICSYKYVVKYTYAESYKYVHIMNIICSYLYVVIYLVAIVYNTPDYTPTLTGYCGIHNI